MTELWKKTAGLLVNNRHVIVASGLAIYVVIGLGQYLACTVWPSLPESTQMAIAENLVWAARAPL